MRRFHLFHLKLPTQDYHGSGRPHTHLVGFGESPADWHMEEWARATLPGEDDPVGRGLVRRGQMERSAESKWDIHEGPSMWDEAAQTYRLHHTAEDKENGLRAWVEDKMQVERCHQDLQYGTGAL